MSDKFIVSAAIRTNVGHGIKALRRSGQIPGVVYGHNIAPTSVQVGERDLSAVLRRVGRNSLITLDVAHGSPKMVLAREVQRDPVTRALIHIDFYEVSMTEMITASVRIITTGEDESPDLKGGLGVLHQEKSMIAIECLPADLFDTITVDVSKLRIGDAVKVSDLTVPAGVTVLDAPDDEVLRMNRFVEAKAEEVAAESAEVEVIEKGKKDEEAEAKK